MKKLFVFNQEKISIIEQTMQVLSFLSNIQKAEKISVIVDEINIEGEGNKYFSFASIYRPETLVRCIKADYREYLNGGGVEKAETYIIQCPDDPLVLGKVISQVKKSTVPIMALLLIEEPSPTMAPLNTTVAKPVPVKIEKPKEELAENEKRLQHKLRRARAALVFSKSLLVLGGLALIAAVVLYGKGRLF